MTTGYHPYHTTIIAVVGLVALAVIGIAFAFSGGGC